MYAITGITGQVGGSVANSLLQQDLKVRAIVRSPDKARQWAEKGCEITLADFNDPKAMGAAFSNVEGAFIMNPANFAPAPGFPETRAVLASVQKALAAARPPKIVGQPRGFRAHLCFSARNEASTPFRCAEASFYDFRVSLQSVKLKCKEEKEGQCVHEEISIHYRNYCAQHE